MLSGTIIFCWHLINVVYNRYSTHQLVEYEIAVSYLSRGGVFLETIFHSSYALVEYGFQKHSSPRKIWNSYLIFHSLISEVSTTTCRRLCCNFNIVFLNTWQVVAQAIPVAEPWHRHTDTVHWGGYTGHTLSIPSYHGIHFSEGTPMGTYIHYVIFCHIARGCGVVCHL